MAKDDKKDLARAHQAIATKKQRKATNSKLNMLDREVKNAVKRGATKYGSGPLKDGARKPSVASKTNAKNKIKANPKIGLSPTSSALERARAKRGNK